MKLSPDFYSRVLALITAIIGLLVMAGWFLNEVVLIQIHSTLVPMQFNTALSFFLGALAILLISYNKKVTGLLLVFFVLGLSVVTLSEYAFGTNMGVDELFIDHYITTHSPNPGRMSVNTALCFFVLSIAIILRHIKQGLLGLSIPFSAFVASIGTISAVGYLIEVEAAYSWAKGFSAMALHTSIAFILLGLSSLLIRDTNKTNYKTQALSLSSYVTMLITFFAVTVFVDLFRKEAAVKAALAARVDISVEELALINTLPSSAQSLFISFLVLALLLGAFVYAFMISVNQSKTLKVQSEALKDANAELEEFAYRTSHDLRSPLGSAIKMLELSERFMKEGNLEKTTLLKKTAHDSLVKLDGLVKDILDLTRTKNADEELRLVSVPQLIDESIEKLKGMDGFEQLEILKAYAYAEHVTVKESRLRLIVENLMSNAVKYADAKKTKPYIKLYTRKENKTLVIAIEDNGLGIPKHKQDKLFNMFQRFHPDCAYGSGLGLYMIKKSADILDGLVKYEDLGSGSRFSLFVPINGKRKVNDAD